MGRLSWRSFGQLKLNKCEDAKSAIVDRAQPLVKARGRIGMGSPLPGERVSLSFEAAFPNRENEHDLHMREPLPMESPGPECMRQIYSGLRPDPRKTRWEASQPANGSPHLPLQKP